MAARKLNAVPAESEVFDTRAEVAQAQIDYPPYPFVGLDGATYYLPNPLLLTSGDQQEVIQAQAEGNASKVEIALRLLLGAKAPEALAAIDQLPSIVVGRLMDRWQSQSMAGVEELGEGLSVPSAPNRAARRSRQTSPSGVSTSTRSRGGRSPAVPRS